MRRQRGSEVLARVSQLIELRVAEIKRYVDRNLDKIKYVEEETEIEDKPGASHCKHLNKLARNAEGVTNEKKDLKEKALSLCGSGNVGLTDGDRSGKTEAENGQRLKKVCQNMKIHDNKLLIKYCFSWCSLGEAWGT